jgi:hypothetical protein
MRPRRGELLAQNSWPSPVERYLSPGRKGVADHEYIFHLARPVAIRRLADTERVAFHNDLLAGFVSGHKRPTGLLDPTDLGIEADLFAGKTEHSWREASYDSFAGERRHR